jgi:signal transduction histidine kinase
VTDRVLADVRSAVNGLNASPDGKGLVGSLTAYLRDVQGLAGPRIVFRPYGWPELSTEVERELFRIAQEAVSNAIRHAGAETVTVLLEGGPSGRRLVVEDDGVGIEPGSEAGLGLETMRRRAERIEAAFTTGPGPDGGTRVEVRLERDPGHVVISSGRRDAAR